MIRVGLIGLGEAVQVLHLPALGKLRDRFTVTAVADVSPKAVDYTAETLHIPYRFYDSDKLLRSSAVDAVVICSPDAYHTQQVCLALEHGKHVLIEKTAALCLEDLDRMIAAAKAHPALASMVGYVRRYAHFFRKLKKLLAAAPARSHTCATGHWYAKRRSTYGRPARFSVRTISRKTQSMTTAACGRSS